jgi:hypothetical protein
MFVRDKRIFKGEGIKIRFLEVKSQINVCNQWDCNGMDKLYSAGVKL